MINLLLASLLFCRTSVSDVLVLLLFPGIFVWAIIAVIIYYFVDRARLADQVSRREDDRGHRSGIWQRYDIIIAHGRSEHERS